jgi:hypothetical protein
VCVEIAGLSFFKIQSVTDVVIPHSRIMISKDGDWYSFFYRCLTGLELAASLAVRR